MKSAYTSLLAALLFLVVTLLSLECSDEVSGNGTDVGNAALGVVYDYDGTPAEGATILFTGDGADPRTDLPIAQTITGAGGTYSVGGIPEGEYNIFATKDGRGAVQISVAVGPSDTTYLPADTLQDFGSTCGTIRLLGEPQDAEVYLMLMGTNTYTTADTSGQFCFEDLPAADYHLRIVTTASGYGPFDTIVSVEAGSLMTLIDTIAINSGDLPVPTGLAAGYDTADRVVTLQWTPVTESVCEGYYVFRRSGDSALQLVTQPRLTVPVYVDSSVCQGMLYTYRVAAVDPDENVGLLSDPAAVLATSYMRTDTLLAGTTTGPFAEPIDIACGPDGKVYVVESDAAHVRVLDHDLTEETVLGQDTLAEPVRIALDSAGAAYVLDVQRTGTEVLTRLVVFGPAGNHQTTLATDGYLKDIDIHGDRLYAVKGADSVIVTDTDGTRLSSWGLSQAGMVLPKWIIATTDGCVYVSDGPTHQVAQFSSDGSLLASIAVGGYASSVAYDSANGRMYVCHLVGEGRCEEGSQGIAVLGPQKQSVARCVLTMADPVGEPVSLGVTPEGRVVAALGTSNRLALLTCLAARL